MSIANTRVFKYMFSYFTAAGVCLGFAAVYEFLTDRFSAYLTVMFLFPLLGGLPYAIRYVANRREPVAAARSLYGAGLAVLTVTSGTAGVLETLGRTEGLPDCVWVTGIVLTIGGSLISLVHDLRIRRLRRRRQ